MGVAGTKVSSLGNFEGGNHLWDDCYLMWGGTTFRGEKAIIMMKGCIIQLLQNARSMLCHYIETKRHANIYLPRHTENFQTLPRHTYPINVT